MPEVADPGNLAHHLKRYQFALPYSRGKVVLDVGAGIGYGADTVAREARRVYAVDYDPVAIGHGKDRFKRVKSFAGDATSLPVRSAVIQVVLGFEVIEHVLDHACFLREICRVLTPDGILLVSTPNRATTELFRRKARFASEAHVSEVSLASFRRELQACFSRVRIFGMRTRGNALYTLIRALDLWNLRLRISSARQVRFARDRVFGVPSERVSLDDVVVSEWHLGQANNFLAVCEGKRP